MVTQATANERWSLSLYIHVHTSHINSQWILYVKMSEIFNRFANDTVLSSDSSQNVFIKQQTSLAKNTKAIPTFIGMTGAPSLNTVSSFLNTTQGCAAISRGHSWNLRSC